MSKKKEHKTVSLKNQKLLHTPFDVQLIIAVVLLCVFGSIMIYSASYYYVEHTQGDAPNSAFISQVEFSLIGFIIMLGIAFVRPNFWYYFGFLAVILSFGCIVLLKTPLRYSSHGATRWIKLFGITLQVAEPIKIGFIVFMAWFIRKYKITEKRNFIILAGVFLVMALLLLKVSNNLSTAIVLCLMLYCVLVVNLPNSRWLVILGVIGVAAIVLLILGIKYLLPYDADENFRITRIRAWLDPTDSRFADQTYQATLALYAIASGGFFGKGLGQSLIKFVLPEPHNDYILAIIFEELGIFGVIMLTFLFVYLLYRIFRISQETKQLFPRLLCQGVFFHISAQVLINYAVTLGLFPTTGVTLSFISAGGSAVVFTMAEIGLVLGVDRQNKELRYYKEAEKETEKEFPEYRELAAKHAELSNRNDKKRKKIQRRAVSGGRNGR